MKTDSRIRFRFSPALVVATIALAVSLGGTGYAAFKLPAGSVGPAQLKNGAVTSLKVRNGTLLKADFKPGQFPVALRGTVGPQGPAGPQGLAGPQGQKGDKGDAGPQGVAGTFESSKLHVKTFASVVVPAGNYAGPDVSCDSGQLALGGGISSGYSWEVQMIYPVSATTWKIRVRNPTGGAENFQPVLLCYGA